MSETTTRRTEIAGIPLGKRKEPLQPTIDAFASKGVIIQPNMVTNLRGGFSSGEGVVDRLSCAEVLSKDDASAKDTFYEKLATAGVSKRQRQNTATSRHRLMSVGFTEAIAAEHESNSDTIRECLVAMRADFMLSLQSNPSEELRDAFLRQARQYISDYTRPVYRVKTAHMKLQEQWDGDTPESFYQILYGVLGTRSVGTWTPYEISVLQAFYQQRLAKASGGKAPLSEFDKRVLSGYLNREKYDAIADDLKSRSKIHVTPDVIEHHVHALLHGSPYHNGQSPNGKRV